MSQKMTYQSNFNHYLRFNGRHQKTTTGYAFYYTASGFSFLVEGSYVKLIFNSYYEDEAKKAYIVIIYDQQEETHVLELGETIITLELSKTPSKIQVIKRSESMMSRSEIVSIETDGVFSYLKEEQPRMKLTFIGDSLTCGYGNLSNDPDLPFSTQYEDGLKSYASLAASILQVDYEIVAVSGIGLYKSIYANVTMPGIYEQYDIYDTKPYPFPQDDDIVILNIGTNDNSYMKFLVEPTREHEMIQFKKSYMNFLYRIRELHPKAKIIGISQGDRQTYVDPLIEESIKEIGLTNIYHLRISDVPTSDGIGQQYHPTVITHQRWSEELIDFIKQLRK
jgi:lysophospholipase L1-like esterase